MENRTDSFLKSISYSIISSIISIVLSALMTIMLPKFITINEYGLWQLFLFYNSYVGVCHLGMSDGFYLRNIGKSYSDIDFKSVTNQIFLTVICASIVAFITYFTIRILGIEALKLEILLLVLITVPIAHFKCICIFFFQATNHIKEYAMNNIFENTIFFICVLSTILLDSISFEKIYLSFIFSLTLSTLYIAFTLKDKLKINFQDFSKSYQECIENLASGSKLLLANIANTLIIGCVRYGVSYGWSIIYFGKISLTLSLCNFLMVFINSLSFAFIPNIKFLSEEILDEFYICMRSITNVVLFVFMLAYYPIYVTMKSWLPQYADSLIYMSLLFPICIYECRSGLLSNSIMKVLRKEELLFKINLMTVILSFIITIINVIILHNLNLTVFSILLLYAFRCLFAEYWISRLLNVKVLCDVLKETILVITFLIINIKLCVIYSFIGYSFFLSAYLLFESNRIKNNYFLLKKIL